MEYIKDNNGNITQVITPQVVEQPVHNITEHAIYLAKKRGDIMEDIAIRQRELADLEVEIASFDTVSNTKVGTKLPSEIIEEIKNKTKI